MSVKMLKTTELYNLEMAGLLVYELSPNKAVLFLMTVIILSSLYLKGWLGLLNERIYIKVLGILCSAVTMGSDIFLNGIKSVTGTCQYKLISYHS